jgi:hypothetical protein
VPVPALLTSLIMTVVGLAIVRCLSSLVRGCLQDKEGQIGVKRAPRALRSPSLTAQPPRPG